MISWRGVHWYLLSWVVFLIAGCRRHSWYTDYCVVFITKSCAIFLLRISRQPSGCKTKYTVIMMWNDIFSLLLLCFIQYYIVFTSRSCINTQVFRLLQEHTLSCLRCLTSVRPPDLFRSQTKSSHHTIHPFPQI